MSTILSSNFNGKVIKTSNGFSVSNSVKKLNKLCIEKGFDFESNKAKTGTTYITIITELGDIELRISNHTKRNEQMVDIEYSNKQVVKWLDGGKDQYITYQAINQNTFDLIFEKINIIK